MTINLGSGAITSAYIGANIVDKFYLGGTLVYGSDFDPASLFLSGEEGVWYDPSDLSTMFQDAAGTIPVTASGQNVGLILDKSQGEPSIGADRATNGTFATDTDWTKGSGVTISGGAANATGAALIVEQDMGLVSGQSYVMVADYTETSSLRLRVQGLTELAESASISGTGSGTVFMRFVADGPTVGIAADGAVFSGTIDNLTVRQIPTNSAYQTVSSKRPTLMQLDGLSYLDFANGQGLRTLNITPGTDKVQVFCGVRRAVTGIDMIAEFSTDRFLFAGSFDLRSDDANVLSLSRGDAAAASGQITSVAAGTPPQISVISMQADISADYGIVRNNGTAGTVASADKGAGNFLTYPLFIGSRADTSLYLTGRLYGLICRFGSNLSALQIDGSEQYMAEKTGVTL